MKSMKNLAELHKSLEKNLEKNATAPRLRHLKQNSQQKMSQFFKNF